MQKFWLWLLRFSYRRMRHSYSGVPDGVPGIRDIDSPCTGYEPRKLKLRDGYTDCETDGHYLCQECCHRKKE